MKRKKYFLTKLWPFQTKKFYRFGLVQDDKVVYTKFAFSKQLTLKLRIAITDIMKVCTCYFEEKRGRNRRRGQHGGWMDKRSTGASSVSYRHNFLVLLSDFITMFHRTLKGTKH